MTLPRAVFAAGLGSQFDTTDKFRQGAGLAEAQAAPGQIVGSIIYPFLGLLGAVFVVLMIYAGFLYMTAQGNEDQVEKAKTIIKNAVIGVVIISLAYAITNFVILAMPG